MADYPILAWYSHGLAGDLVEALVVVGVVVLAADGVEVAAGAVAEAGEILTVGAGKKILEGQLTTD
jgi:hypothetical protein